MKPMTEKMTNPANILVALFVHVTIIVSLQRKRGRQRPDEPPGCSAAVLQHFTSVYYITLVCFVFRRVHADKASNSAIWWRG